MRNKTTDNLNNPDARKFFDLAVHCQYKGELDSALYFYNASYELCPNSSVILNERGMLKFSMNDYKGALIEMNKAIELSPNENEKQIRTYNRALIYLSQNKIDSACMDWKNSGKWGKGNLKKYCGKE